MEKVENVKSSGIFKCCIYNAIPLVFDESLSYYETLCALLGYLEKEIKPVINNNAEALAELEDKFVELQSYVEHYFDNLDVQEEINNKLDEMAESGELAEIISQYLALSVCFAYNTISEMSEAENLANGSICNVLGKDTYNDGKGAFYKVRPVTTGDDVDGFNIVALYNTSLVGERIFNNDIINLQDDLEDLTEEINNKFDMLELEDTLFLGDSYANGTTYESGSLEHVDSWAENLRNLMGLTTGHYYIFEQGGAGFAHAINGIRFIDCLQANISQITDKTKIKNVIVCAGYNDYDQSYSDIYDRIGEFITYCKSQFPNAKYYLGMIGGNAADSSTGASIRLNLLNKVLPAYLNSCDFGVTYLSGVENFSHNYYMFDPQGNHPTEVGYQEVAKTIYNALKNGYGNVYQEIKNVNLTLVNNVSTVTISGNIQNGTKTIFMGNIILNNVNLSISSSKVTIIPANTDNKICKPSITGRLEIPVDIWYQDSSSNNKFCTGKLQFNDDGSVNIDSTYFAITGGSIKNLAVYPCTITAQTLLS